MIGVIGLGFVGLTTALGFTHKGYEVYGFDIDVKRTEKLRKGIIPFHEPHLPKFLNKYKNKTFFLCDSLEQVITNTKVVFYCVGTPSDENGKANLDFLENAIEQSLKHIGENEYKVLAVKSTVPPLTTQSKIKPLIEKKGFIVGENIGLVNNPEFLREGFAWEDFINPNRIVIGQSDKKSGSILEDLYKPFNTYVFRTSLNTAEFIKYLSNTLLATLISFSNEMSMLADVVGEIDIPLAFKILHQDKRWFGSPASMTSYVFPGCGFGGYCLPKDTRAINHVAESIGHKTCMIKDVLVINSKIKNHFFNKIIKVADKNNKIGILGLAFKPQSDDIRESVAKDIITMLIDEGFSKIVAYDPMAMDNFKKAYDLPITYASTFEDFVQNCNVVIALTAWQEFKDKKDLLEGKNVIDGRYFLEGME